MSEAMKDQQYSTPFLWAYSTVKNATGILTGDLSVINKDGENN